MNESALEQAAPASETDESLWHSVRDLLRGLQFGTVTLIVQDGVVIQIDRPDKRRLRGSSRATPPGRLERWKEA